MHFDDSNSNFYLPLCKTSVFWIESDKSPVENVNSLIHMHYTMLQKWFEAEIQISAIFYGDS